MTKPYWQAKIWGLLHDPALKALHPNFEPGKNSFWKDFQVMEGWVDDEFDLEKTQKNGLQQIHLADLIASASDRGAIGRLSNRVDYGVGGLQLRHLLSGEPFNFQLSSEFHGLSQRQDRTKTFLDLEQALFSAPLNDSSVKNSDLRPIYKCTDERKVFWWLWRCLPESVCQTFGQDPSLLLMPADPRLPDASIWSHSSMTSALAGALAGYDLTTNHLKTWPLDQDPSRAYLGVFSFSPIQALIKASRKMRDFWSGSWILHYLSARVCWAIAMKYGPDAILYPSLFQQPLIDHWILEKWPDFASWVSKPTPSKLMTAGFPNVIVMVLPEGKVCAAMQMAEQVLKEEWLKLGGLVHETLKDQRWMKSLPLEHKSWNGWLDAQWQTYWSALPIGDRESALTSSEIDHAENKSWADRQNSTFKVDSKRALFK